MLPVARCRRAKPHALSGRPVYSAWQRAWHCAVSLPAFPDAPSCSSTDRCAALGVERSKQPCGAAASAMPAQRNRANATKTANREIAITHGAPRCVAQRRTSFDIVSRKANPRARDSNLRTMPSVAATGSRTFFLCLPSRLPAFDWPLRRAPAFSHLSDGAPYRQR